MSEMFIALCYLFTDDFFVETLGNCYHVYMAVPLNLIYEEISNFPNTCNMLTLLHCSDMFVEMPYGTAIQILLKC